MKLTKLTFLFFALSLSTFLSCKKTAVKDLVVYVDKASGTVMDTGSIAADGCDWTIVVNSVYYHPDNLDNKYKVNNAKVTVSYNLLTDKFHCGMIPVSPSNPGMSVIHITSITIN